MKTIFQLFMLGILLMLGIKMFGGLVLAMLALIAMLWPFIVLTVSVIGFVWLCRVMWHAIQ